MVALSDRYLIERAQAGDLQARNDLVMRNHPYAKRCALDAHRTQRHRCGSLVALDDLIQECVMALIRAIDRVCVEKLKGRDLRWYAKLWCRNAIEDALEHVPLIRIPRSTLWLWRHGRLSDRGRRDVVDCVDRKIGTRADLAVDRRLWPEYEAMVREMENGRWQH